ncbi:type I site-specific restriction-modification system R (restriction) subunit [candidate division TM7 genomosp. GTL1]|nr:type I site-specific restriction-modification system R (restriction) subunit [candidate division TM7 genomosp. GTL1]
MWLFALIIGAFTNDINLALSWGFVFLVASFFVKRDEPTLTPHEEELYQGILNKLGQPLFRTDTRITVAAESSQRIDQLFKGVSGSLAPLNSPFQALGDSALFQNKVSYRFREFKFTRRLPSLLVTNSSIFAASELASIYHFPYGTIKTEGMVRSHSRTLPATLGMKNNKFDVVLGRNNHHGEITPIGLTAAERERHVFIIGGAGNGKTTMLQYAIAQDIKNGKGVAVVDPHGDMAETLLQHIPEKRINDVIYFNPDDLAYPIGLNLLELTPGLEGDELLREKDLVTESVVSVFRKIFSEDDTGGHRIEYVLRNAIQTALYVKDATLFTVYDLLNDPVYRKQVMKDIDDKNLVNFWKQELGKAGDMQKVKMAAGITAKIGRFLFSASAKRILEQPRSTINFDGILDGKILICNFSKGLLGEDTSELFGIAILAKIQLASLRRARLKQADRRPFYLYVDEFQNFATPSFVQMLSEARKYKLYLTMAEQTTSQQDEQQMVNVILANVGTVICFRSGNPSDEQTEEYAKSKFKWQIGEDVMPFVYEATSKEVRFTDLRDPRPRFRELFAFHCPETLLEWSKSAKSLRASFSDIPELDETGLRACQVIAINNLETSLKDNRP